MPGSSLCRYSPVPGCSVPVCCVTRYCSGDSPEIASVSLMNFRIPVSFVGLWFIRCTSSRSRRRVSEPARDRRRTPSAHGADAGDPSTGRALPESSPGGGSPHARAHPSRTAMFLVRQVRDVSEYGRILVRLVQRGECPGSSPLRVASEFHYDPFVCVTTGLHHARSFASIRRWYCGTRRYAAGRTPPVG